MFSGMSQINKYFRLCRQHILYLKYLTLSCGMEAGRDNTYMNMHGHVTIKFKNQGAVQI
jgi:hypothetical protein